ncbi:transcription factor TFIIF complex subunit Tfg3 [Savitreella phatthalungensis]
MSETIQKTIKFVTTQEILHDRPPISGFPVRKWSVGVVVDDGAGNEVPPGFVDKVVFKLHPTFVNPNKTVKRPPFKITEEGWGEFEMHIVLHFAEGGGSQTLSHDLNFASDRYDKPHVLTFRNPKPAFQRVLNGGGVGGEGSGGNTPAPSNGHGVGGGDEKKRSLESGGGGGGAGSGSQPAAKKKKTKARAVDIDKLADGLQQLGEDDLLQIVQLVNNNKTDDMYVRNDLDEGEFHIDLYTLTDQLLIDMMKIVDNARR